MLSLLQITLFTITAALIAIINNLIRQVLFAATNEPPVVFHWLPYVGNTFAYNADPSKFLYTCRQRYGDVFTFILWGRKTTVYQSDPADDTVVTPKDLNASKPTNLCGPLCTPISSSSTPKDHVRSDDVEQKEFSGSPLVQQILNSHVELVEQKVLECIEYNALSNFKGNAGSANGPDAMAQINTAIANQVSDDDNGYKKLLADPSNAYDLEKGLSIIMLLFPWVSIMHSGIREASRMKIQDMYMQIIQQRRAGKGAINADMLTNLTRHIYESDEADPDTSIAHVMTAFTEGQRASAHISGWILMHLANSPEIVERLYLEQQEKLLPGTGGTIRNLRYEDLGQLTLHGNVVRETMRMYSLMPGSLREVKDPLPVHGTSYTIPSGHFVTTYSVPSTDGLVHSMDLSFWDPDRWANNRGRQDDRTECVGERLVHINLLVITATLIRTFKVWNLAGIKKVPAKDWSSIHPSPQQPAMIKWERRGGGEKVR